MEDKILRLKELVLQIEELQDCSVAFGLLFEQEVKLAKLQIEVNQIIKEL
jgi:hypothetical protein